MKRLLASAGVVLLLSITVAGATTLVKLDFADLVEQADQVVVGTVVLTQGYWEETQRFIHTEVTLSVDRYLMGEGPSEIVLSTPGGTVGGRGMVAHGAATFEVGEQVLVFLTTWQDGTPKVLGYTQGKSSMIEDWDGRLVLQGGVADGRSLDGVIEELRHGSDHLIPLRPAN